jgi:energy-coupling factor transport system permease protein
VSKQLLQRPLKSAHHPLTWWIWSIALAIAIVRTDNAFVALGVVGVAALIVKSFAEDAPWANSFWWSIKLGIWIVCIRTIIAVLIGVPIPGTTLVTLPILPLPDWIAGIRIGGTITLERISSSVHEGVIIASVIALFGAATSLTSPHRLLRVTPVFIYEVGVALVIATSVLPQLVASIGRIRRAHTLRGDESPSWRKIAIPLLEDALARSLDLAASMDSRGYGSSKKRSRYRPTRWSRSDSLIASGAIVTIFLLPLVAP